MSGRLEHSDPQCSVIASDFESGAEFVSVCDVDG